MAPQFSKTKKGDKTVTLDQIDKAFYNKILSRNSSVSGSQRLSIHRRAGEVPFSWELAPGKPKDPPKDEIVAPVKTPPVLHSLTMPKPCVPPSGSRAYLWRKVRSMNRFKMVRLLPKKSKVTESTDHHIGSDPDGDGDDHTRASDDSEGHIDSSNSNSDSGSSPLACNSSSSLSSVASSLPSSSSKAIMKVTKIRSFAKGFVKWAFSRNGRRVARLSF